MTSTKLTIALLASTLSLLPACDEPDFDADEPRAAQSDHVEFVAGRHGPQAVNSDGALTSVVYVDREWSWSANDFIPLDKDGQRLTNPTTYAGPLDFEPINGTTLACFCANVNGGWTQGGCTTPCAECCPDNGGAWMDGVTICSNFEDPNGQSPVTVPPCN